MLRFVDGGVTAAKDFTASGIRCGIKQQGTDLAVIYSELDCSAAGVFTTNAFKAAPVLLSCERLDSGRARAIVANSGNANACTGEQGLKDAERVCARAADLLGIAPELVLNASTGIIGAPLPVEKIESGLEKAVRSLAEDGGFQAALAIMTTDTRPKLSAYEIELAGTKVRVGGICKGAGMICPNMATMLCFITSDAQIEASVLRRSLASNVERSFNCLTVDGDMSTNDCVIVLANGASGCRPIVEGSPDYDLFDRALGQVCLDLAKAVAKDGEGATKYVEVRVKGAATYDDAKAAAMSVANSPLVKTAIFGQDPNWGRVLCAIGKSGAKVVPEKTSLMFGDVKIVDRGEPVGVDTDKAKKPMLETELVISVDLGLGTYDATAFTCDLSYDYVRINAEYHT
ncbi:MAG: bifunctional glutamate N-acetyltransferase/amino-acid acetyltransferase ArgJ [Armatimonadetes bacterium]|nr:bifunctional glutamate N-acetyltransferase/amino-acid acetyltransferase ArgJ [Armatimonadota bacterium]